jgi:hypothetical protein
MTDRLERLRGPLLELHREILGAERFDLERFHGRMSGAEFLQVVTDSLRYSWLLPLSELIVAIDEALAAEEPEPAEPLLDRARGLLLPPDDATAFGHQYLRLLQQAPGVAVAHGAVRRALD